MEHRTLHSVAPTRTEILVASDGMRLNLRHFAGSKPVGSRCLIVAPGFAQYSSTLTFSQLCEGLSVYAEVFCLDFRGTGDSDGLYGWGWNEYLDVEAALRFARARFDEVDLLGFSLGAYSSLRATATLEDVWPDRLFLVSCPTKIEDIFFGGSLLAHTLTALFAPAAPIRDRITKLKLGPPFKDKPCASELATRLKVPTHFLVGGLDRLTPKSMSAKVFQAVPHLDKSWKEVELGRHAERMYFEDPTHLTDWIFGADSREAINVGLASGEPVPATSFAPMAVATRERTDTGDVPSDSQSDNT